MPPQDGMDISSRHSLVIGALLGDTECLIDRQDFIIEDASPREAH